MVAILSRGRWVNSIITRHIWSCLIETCCGNQIRNDMCFLSGNEETLICYLLVINSLGPSDAIWWQGSGSTLTQVMACCLTAPSHYLNQCWLLISKVEWHSSKGKFTRDTSAINHEVICEIKYLNFHSNFPGVNELTHLPLMLHICVSELGQHWFR